MKSSFYVTCLDLVDFKIFLGNSLVIQWDQYFHCRDSGWNHGQGTKSLPTSCTVEWKKKIFSLTHEQFNHICFGVVFFNILCAWGFLSFLDLWVHSFHELLKVFTHFLYSLWELQLHKYSFTIAQRCFVHFFGCFFFWGCHFG